MSTGNRYTL